ITQLDGSPRLLRNLPSGSRRPDPQAHWLTIKTVGKRSNRDGFGARIELNAGGQVQVQEVRANSSFLSASDPRAHFGLGAAERIETITIRWPSGIQDTIHNQAADQELVVEEGNGVSNRIRPAAVPKRSVSITSSK